MKLKKRQVFAPDSVHVEIFVDKLALGQHSLRVIRFSPVSIIPPLVSMLIYYLKDDQ
jgi:hypothetical protein